MKKIVDDEISDELSTHLFEQLNDKGLFAPADEARQAVSGLDKTGLEARLNKLKTYINALPEVEGVDLLNLCRRLCAVVSATAARGVDKGSICALIRIMAGQDIRVCLEPVFDNDTAPVGSPRILAVL